MGLALLPVLLCSQNQTGIVCSTKSKPSKLETKRKMTGSSSSSKTLLRIDASARLTRSLTHALGDLFVAEWQKKRPHDTIISRDVGQNPPPAISEAFIAAAFTNKEERTLEQEKVLALSDELIVELKAADIVILDTPMYNYGMPAALKAWFDTVFRVNETFTFDLKRGDRPLASIQSGKTLVVLTSTGEFGFGPGEFNQDHGHLLPHIKSMARYLGFHVEQNFYHVGIEYQEFQDERFALSKKLAFEAVPSLVEALVQDLKRE